MTMLTDETEWEMARPAMDKDALHVDLDGYEGPLDLLLTLARQQKVDLATISILALVEQYIDYIRRAHRLKLEIAADYLVMAAWLAYLKSRLLLPRDDAGEEPSAEELSLRLQLRLQRLNAMRDVAGRLMGRDRLGRDFFLRGAPEGLSVDRQARYDLTLYELLKAYGDHHLRAGASEVRIARRPVVSLEDALGWLADALGEAPDWQTLVSYLPAELQDAVRRRSAMASYFAAGLELARQGLIDIEQREAFGPVYIRRRRQEQAS